MSIDATGLSVPVLPFFVCACAAFFFSVIICCEELLRGSGGSRQYGQHGKRATVCIGVWQSNFTSFAFVTEPGV